MHLSAQRLLRVFGTLAILLIACEQPESFNTTCGDTGNEVEKKLLEARKSLAEAEAGLESINTIKTSLEARCQQIKRVVDKLDIEQGEWRTKCIIGATNKFYPCSYSYEQSPLNAMSCLFKISCPELTPLVQDRSPVDVLVFELVDSGGIHYFNVTTKYGSGNDFYCQTNPIPPQ